MIKGLPGDYFAASLSGKMHLYFKYFILTGWWAEEGVTIANGNLKLFYQKNASYKSTRFHSSTVYTVKRGFSPYCHTDKFPLQVKDFFLLAFNNWHKFPLQMKGYFFTAFTQTSVQLSHAIPEEWIFLISCLSNPHKLKRI